jgi:hypothetical protein
LGHRQDLPPAPDAAKDTRDNSGGVAHDRRHRDAWRVARPTLVSKDSGKDRAEESESQKQRAARPRRHAEVPGIVLVVLVVLGDTEHSGVRGCLEPPGMNGSRTVEGSLTEWLLHQALKMHPGTVENSGRFGRLEEPGWEARRALWPNLFTA